MRRLDLGSGKRELLMRHFLTNKSVETLLQVAEALPLANHARALVRPEGIMANQPLTLPSS